jgi:hypothetical protein
VVKPVNYGAQLLILVNVRYSGLQGSNWLIAESPVIRCSVLRTQKWICSSTLVGFAGLVKGHGDRNGLWSWEGDDGGNGGGRS